MSFTPIIPSTGLSGWNFLNRTIERQTEVFDRSPDIERDVAYFETTIKDISSLDEFMADRRVLKVALGAFGLGDEINKGAFVRKVIEEGTSDSKSFANRLNNSDYIAMAEMFSVESGRMSLNADAISQVSRKYKDNMFEISVGEVDDDMRLALNFQRDIPEIAAENHSQKGGWFQLMGSLPLRTVIETAFNLPDEFSQIDLDKQAEILADKANTLFGSSSIDFLRDPENIEKVIRRYQLIRQVETGSVGTSATSNALTLLSGGLGSTGLENLIVSSRAL